MMITLCFASQMLLGSVRSHSLLAKTQVQTKISIKPSLKKVLRVACLARVQTPIIAAILCVEKATCSQGPDRLQRKMGLNDRDAGKGPPVALRLHGVEVPEAGLRRGGS